jgi:hypothetical protein
MAHICHTAPILSGYQTYATFHDTSMENAVIDSRSSMPMTLYFAICNFSCPEIVFASLPRRPPDGILTTFIVSTFIGFIFGIMTLRACIKISAYSLRKSIMATIQATIQHKNSFVALMTLILHDFPSTMPTAILQSWITIMLGIHIFLTFSLTSIFWRISSVMREFSRNFIVKRNLRKVFGSFPNINPCDSFIN